MAKKKKQAEPAHTAEAIKTLIDALRPEEQQRLRHMIETSWSDAVAEQTVTVSLAGIAPTPETQTVTSSRDVTRSPSLKQ